MKWNQNVISHIPNSGII